MRLAVTFIYLEGFHILMCLVGETSGLDFTVARGPVPRDGSRTVFFTVARGPSDAIRASERVSPAISIVTMCVSPTVVCDRQITNR